jgi:anti-sigma regulatory factor (Ser/Thr protein kinase)
MHEGIPVRRPPGWVRQAAMAAGPLASGGEAAETFVPGPLAPRQARRWIERVLEGWALSELVTDVLLVVSELITNAVEHGTGPVVLRVVHRAPAFPSSAAPGCLRLEVSDDGGGRVAVRDSSPTETGGWGLLVVTHLAAQWGVIDHPPAGKTVWVELGPP